MAAQTPVSLEGVRSARETLRDHLRPTRLATYPLLDRLLGCEVFVKHENENPTGSFKVRGGLNLVQGLSAGERARGLVTATRGNHGQSIAYAAGWAAVPATIVVPVGNNPEKNAAMRALGAELIEFGRDFDEARLRVEELQHERNLRYVHSANEPDLIHGVGTYALEILEELADPDVIFVPVGGGSGACGTLTVVRALAPTVKVIGVQAASAPAIYESWRRGSHFETDSADTIADGLATRVPFELTIDIMRRHIDEIVTVTEQQLEEAVYRFYETTHTVAEPAAAASLAAALAAKDRLAGRKVVLVATGSNITAELFHSILGRFVG